MSRAAATAKSRRRPYGPKSSVTNTRSTPASGASAGTGEHWIDDEQRHHLAARRGCGQRRVVVQTQVASKPDDRTAHRMYVADGLIAQSSRRRAATNASCG